MAKDKFDRTWITQNSVKILERYENITLRGLHYQLVGLGMTNSIQHYKRVVTAMIKARWEGVVEFDEFIDHDRETIGSTKSELTDVDDKISEAKSQMKLWMKNYSKNRWENQGIYPEVFIEKKALIGAFKSVCEKHNVALNPCKGYPSLTFLHDAKLRFEDEIENGKKVVILYFGDYDPSGEDIPRSIEENLLRMGVEVKVDRIALKEKQVVEWKLPPAPVKSTDSRTANWSGIGQVELDAVVPDKLYALCESAILKYFDEGVYDTLIELETQEREEFQKELKLFAADL